MNVRLVLKSIKPTRRVIPYVVLWGALLLTGIITYYVDSTARTKDRLRFDNAVEQTQNQIQERINTYIALLRAGSGLFAASTQVQPQEFRVFVQRLGLQEYYPGIQGVGFSIRLTPEQTEAFVQEMREKGFENFRIYPDYKRDEYHAITYLEPLERRNQTAIGYDMYTEPIRQRAMEQARDRGEATASGRVTLVQEIDQDKQAGFLIYLPIYQGGIVPETIRERREKLKGFIYSPFRADDFINGIFGTPEARLVNFNIYDGDAINSNYLLHRCELNVVNRKPYFKTVQTLNIAGRTWTIEFASRFEMDQNSESRLVPFIAMTGVVVSFILFGVTRSQVQARMAAERANADLRQSEQALRQSEERFLAFMDHNPAAAWMSDRHGRIFYLNKTYYQMFDVPQNLLGKSAYEIYPPAYADVFVENIKSVADQNQVLEFIERAPRPDGSMGEFLVYKFPVTDPFGQRLIGGVALDITESRQAQDLIRRSEIRFRTLIEQSPMSIQILSTSGKTLQVNRAWEKLWGLKLENLENYNLLQDPQLIEKGLMPLIKSAFAGEALTLPSILYDTNATFPHLAGQNSQSWVQAYIYPVKDEVGEVREVVLMHEDITERQQAEEELRESEARFKTLIETTFDGIVIHEAGTIVDANQGVATMFGCPLSEIIGQSILDFTIPESWEIILKNIQFNLNEPYEAVGLRRDGTTFSVEIIGKPHIYKGRNVRVTALRDISSRKLLEAQLRARAEELAEANRLKDEFLATLSHELRTPLNTMLGWSQMLMSKRLDEKTYIRATETIHRNTRSLALIIEDLLDVSRIITGKLHFTLSPMSLIPAIEGALETVHATALIKQIEIEADLDVTVGWILGDLNRLQQVVWNLLTNAVKFTPERGHIQVKLSQVDGFAQIQVKDTGQGIDPEFLPYVFERFRQGDGSITRSHGGLGLGLAIVRHLVELHGGEVEVESPGLGQGATFTVKLPLMSAEQNSVKALIEDKRLQNATLAKSPPKLDGLRILVVEDEADALELVVHVLAEFGATVEAVTNATEAIAKLKAQDSTSAFDVLVSDIGLPQEDGYSFIQRVRRLADPEGKQIPALALTAYASAADRRAALQAGFQAHLAKPFEPIELANAIAQLVKTGNRE